MDNNEPEEVEVAAEETELVEAGVQPDAVAEHEAALALTRKLLFPMEQ
jgi:hypothetical protein